MSRTVFSERFTGVFAISAVTIREYDVRTTSSLLSKDSSVESAPAHHHLSGAAPSIVWNEIVVLALEFETGFVTEPTHNPTTTISVDRRWRQLVRVSYSVRR